MNHHVADRQKENQRIERQRPPVPPPFHEPNHQRFVCKQVNLVRRLRNYEARIRPLSFDWNGKLKLISEFPTSKQPFVC